jgi:hypothetical protein
MSVLAHKIAARSAFASLALAAVSVSGAANAFAAAPARPAAKTAAASTITVSEVTNSQVTVSPDGKTILADIQGLIYTMPAAGGTAKRLTQPFQEASHPDWSKVGDIVALQCYAGGTFHIWTMKPDGTGLKQVTSGHGDDREPRISPDGKTIIFASDRAFKTAENGASQGSYDIWTVPVAGGEPTQLTFSDADEFGPSWSPDGKKIAFVSGVGLTATTIQVMDASGGKPAEILKVGGANRVEAPSWSPDAKRLAYVEFEASDPRAVNTGLLKIVGADGKGAPKVAKSSDVYPFPAVWTSPTELVYSGSGHIVKMDVASGLESEVPFTAAIPFQPHGFKRKVRLRLGTGEAGEGHLRTGTIA